MPVPFASGTNGVVQCIFSDSFETAGVHSAAFRNAVLRGSKFGLIATDKLKLRLA